METIQSNFLQFINIKKSNLNLNKVLYYAAVLIGISLNLFIALRSPTFFHPDEVYQTLEVAHKFVYGYGLITWDWKLNSWYVIGNQQSYGGVRSLITPMFFSIIFILGNALNLNYWNQILPLTRVILVLNFIFGIYIASKLLKELDPDEYKISNKIFLIFALFYQDLLLYSSKTITNTMITPIMFFPLYIWMKKDLEERQDKWALELIAGFLVGISIWMRPDSGIIMAFFVLLNTEKLKLRKFVTFGTGFFISFILNGYLDLLYYGKFFVSFINFLNFNSDNQALFGTNPFGWYFQTFILERGSFFYIFLLTSILLLIFLIYYIYNTIFEKKQNELFVRRFELLIKLIFWTFLVLMWWETQPHKEERFMISWEIVYLFLGAYTISLITKYLAQLSSGELLSQLSFLKLLKDGKDSVVRQVNIIIIIFIIVSLPFLASNVNEATDRSWNNFNDVLEAFVWVGQQNVTGVGIVMPILYTGGYSYLHKNVTIEYLDHPFAGTIFIPAYLAQQHIINYFIVPKYRYNEIQNLYNATEHSFTLKHVIYGSCDIWEYTK